MCLCVFVVSRSRPNDTLSHLARANRNHSGAAWQDMGLGRWCSGHTQDNPAPTPASHQFFGFGFVLDFSFFTLDLFSSSLRSSFFFSSFFLSYFCCWCCCLFLVLFWVCFAFFCHCHVRAHTLILLGTPHGRLASFLHYISRVPTYTNRRKEIVKNLVKEV